MICYRLPSIHHCWELFPHPQSPVSTPMLHIAELNHYSILRLATSFRGVQCKIKLQTSECCVNGSSTELSQTWTPSKHRCPHADALGASPALAPLLLSCGLLSAVGRDSQTQVRSVSILLSFICTKTKKNKTKQEKKKPLAQPCKTGDSM